MPATPLKCSQAAATVFSSQYTTTTISAFNSAIPSQINAYTSTGTSHSAAVGRISFLLDWKGPSVAVDTACSSSLVAVHLACQSLRAYECHMALAGGVSLILAPEELISINRLGMLAADGFCKTFDSRADGFVPGEGCGIAVLKRLSDALGTAIPSGPSFVDRPSTRTADPPSSRRQMDCRSRP